MRGESIDIGSGASMQLLHYPVVVPILLAFHLFVGAKQIVRTLDPTLPLSPQKIIQSLHSLTVRGNETTHLLEALLIMPANAPKAGLSVLVQSKAHLNNTTLAYLAFSARFGNNPGPAVLDEPITKVLLLAADLHSKTFSAMGIALARSLPIYNEHGIYVTGCEDGVKIGLHAITLFAQLALKFPRAAIALILDGLETNLRVPLAQLSALGCFLPILGPLR
ncbi:hypothetical protein C8R43DRAFT_962196 [Mycena crocata]|nr:hypothetical protein C8R43DRAFT_962196 [Mycena crocata]